MSYDFGQSVSATRCICTLYLKYILKYLKMSNKYKKISRVYVGMSHAHKVISAKTDMICAPCKKYKFWC
jgi:hypothetical protein